MIQNVETMTEAFVEYLEKIDVATFGEDLFINKVPSSKNTQNSVYWVMTSPGNPVRKNATGEVIRLHSVVINYRDIRGEKVEKTLFHLSELLIDPGCVRLTGFTVVDITVSQYPAQPDIDQEDRMTGFLQINIQTYKRSA